MAGGHDLGTISGVLVPTCENMWGVLIFLRFFFVVGHAGVWQSLLIVFVSFMSSFFTTMSLSAMATNGPVEAGGAYFIISRALGHKLGGAVGCTYYLGLSLLAVLEVLGAIEVMLHVEPGLARAWVSREPCDCGRLSCSSRSLSWCGRHEAGFAARPFFAAVVGLTLTSYYAGLIAAAANFVGRDRIVVSNVERQLGSGLHRRRHVLHCAVRLLSVLHRDLGGREQGERSEGSCKVDPWGTLAAITLSFCMYASYMIMWARSRIEIPQVRTRRSVRRYRRWGAAPPSRGGGGEAMSVVSEIAWPWALPTQIGIIIASLSQALQCLISAPRILNAIAADGTVPFLNVARTLNDKGEPAIALAITTGLCLVASMIGSLDLVAPLLSICFLSAYAALNFSTFVLGLTRAPSWRPTWRFFHWSLGLAGFLLCTTLAFVITWYFALVAVALLAGLVAYIESRQVQVTGAARWEEFGWTWRLLRC